MTNPDAPLTEEERYRLYDPMLKSTHYLTPRISLREARLLISLRAGTHVVVPRELLERIAGDGLYNSDRIAIARQALGDPT